MPSQARGYTNPSERIAELVGVDAGYGGALTLRGVSVGIEPGATLAVCGPNGAGKSTLLRVLAGLVPARAGEVRLLGEPLARRDRAAIARVVALVPQEVDVVFDFTVREIVAMGRSPHARERSAAESAAIVEAELERLELGALADAPVSELSGGERKRVALARALAQEPRLLLLDEPTASLDVRHESRLFEALRALGERRGLAVVVVLHDFAVAARVASHAIVLCDGAARAVGEAAEVLTPSVLESAFGVELEARASLRVRRTLE